MTEPTKAQRKELWQRLAEIAKVVVLLTCVLLLLALIATAIKLIVDMIVQGGGLPVFWDSLKDLWS